MNLIDCVVTKVLSEPYFAYEKWWVNVLYNSWGTESETSIMCSTEDEAKNIEVGYKFLG